MDRQKIRQFGKNVYKTWKVLLWILRWVSIVLFGVLFFVGVYFKLPWKMLVCIAVIPVVGIFVPRKVQPWIWGALTLFVLSVWGWVQLPEYNSSKWRPYEYTEALNAIEQDYLLGDEDNAADIYSAVFDEYGETIFYFNFRDSKAERLTLTSPWDPNDYPFLDFWLTEFDDGIEQLVQASRIEQCRFEIPHTATADKPQLKRLNQMKGWVRLLIRSANRDLFMDKKPEALEKFLVVPKMAQHLYQQQAFFDQSGALDVELIGVHGINTFIINHCSDIHMLERTQEAFAELDPKWAGNWPDILLREKLIAKNLAALMYEVNDAGRIRISHSAMMALQEGLGYRPQRLFVDQHVMNRLTVIGLWLTLPVSPQRLADIVDERFDHYSLLVQKGEKIQQYNLKYIWIKGLNAQSMIDWLATWKVGYYWALDSKYKWHQAIVNQVCIFSALKRYFLVHKQWPQHLDELGLEDAEYTLIDPVSSKPFVYECQVQDFRLYSVGSNGVDDGGVYDPKQEKDDILLWPKRVFDDEPSHQPDTSD